VINTHTWTT